jgi:hypothetical protein
MKIIHWKVIQGGANETKHTSFDIHKDDKTRVIAKTILSIKNRKNRQISIEILFSKSVEQTSVYWTS